MTRLWASIITLFLLFFVSYATGEWTQNLTDSYVNRLEYAQKLTEGGHWEEAAQITDEVFLHWESQSFPLYILLRHSDLDKIFVCFQSVSQYLSQEDDEPYLANNAQLIAQLNLLAEMEQLSLKNIL
ncbi:MAG: DUF4363 family protein [Eubacteriales bacterium]